MQTDEHNFRSTRESQMALIRLRLMRRRLMRTSAAAAAATTKRSGLLNLPVDWNLSNWFTYYTSSPPCTVLSTNYMRSCTNSSAPCIMSWISSTAQLVCSAAVARQAGEFCVWSDCFIPLSTLFSFFKSGCLDPPTTLPPRSHEIGVKFDNDRKRQVLDGTRKRGSKYIDCYCRIFYDGAQRVYRITWATAHVSTSCEKVSVLLFLLYQTCPLDRNICPTFTIIMDTRHHPAE